MTQYICNTSVFLLIIKIINIAKCITFTNGVPMFS